jgi:hypothetical protein
MYNVHIGPTRWPCHETDSSTCCDQVKGQFRETTVMSSDPVPTCTCIVQGQQGYLMTKHYPVQYSISSISCTIVIFIILYNCKLSSLFALQLYISSVLCAFLHYLSCTVVQSLTFMYNCKFLHYLVRLHIY